MDYDLWLRLADAGIPATYVPRPLAIYEVHGESKTGTVEPSEFVREWAEALLKSGRNRQAAFAFGRAAAASAAAARRSLSAAEVREITERVLRDQQARGRDLDPQAVRAGALVEAAVVELHRSPRGLRHLTQPAVWRYPQTKARLALASRFFVHSLVMRGREVLPG
jgi:hypothetical protein